MLVTPTGLSPARPILTVPDACIQMSVDSHRHLKLNMSKTELTPPPSKKKKKPKKPAFPSVFPMSVSGITSSQQLLLYFSCQRVLSLLTPKYFLHLFTSFGLHCYASRYTKIISGLANCSLLSSLPISILNLFHFFLHLQPVIFKKVCNQAPFGGSQ